MAEFKLDMRHDSPLMIKGQYNEIVKYLKADDKSEFQRKIRRRVASNNYQLMSFLVLWLEDILCISQKNKVRLSSFYRTISIKCHSIVLTYLFL